jgi:hypothetical protein
MSIFTFMGANVMRLDDTYSFQVISKTVKMVIPALIQVSYLNTVIIIFLSCTVLHISAIKCFSEVLTYLCLLNFRGWS